MTKLEELAVSYLISVIDLENLNQRCTDYVYSYSTDYTIGDALFAERDEVEKLSKRAYFEARKAYHQAGRTV